MPGLRLEYGQVQQGALRGHTGPVQCLSPCLGSDMTLISGGSDGTVRIWDPSRSSRVVQCLDMTGLNESVNSVIARNAHEILIAADTHLYRADRRRLDRAPAQICSADDDINQIAVVNDALVAWCDDAGLLYIAAMDRHTSQIEMQADPIQAHENICTSVVSCPESTHSEAMIYTAGMDCKIGVWDLEGAELESLETNASSSASSSGALIDYSMVHNLTCSGDGGLISAALHTCDIMLADTQTYTIGRLHAHTSIVSNVHFTAFRPRDVLLSASSDSTMIVWNLDPSAISDQSHDSFSDAEKSLFDMGLIQSRIRLQYKPNDMVTDIQGRVYVADVSPQIHIYHLI